jgi:hypothetical protein
VSEKTLQEEMAELRQAWSDLVLAMWHALPAWFKLLLRRIP